MNLQKEKRDKQVLEQHQQDLFIDQISQGQLLKSKEKVSEQKMQSSLIMILNDQYFENSQQAKRIDFDQTGFTQQNQNGEKNRPKSLQNEFHNNQPVSLMFRVTPQEMTQYRRIDPSLIRQSKVIKHIRIRDNAKPFIFQPLRVEHPMHISVDRNSTLYKIWQACCQNVSDQQLFQVTDTY